MKWSDLVLRGTHAARPAYSDVPLATLYFETDTELIFYSGASSWQAYSAGAGAEAVAPSGCRIRNNADQDISNTTWTYISFNTVDFEYEEYANLGTNATRLTAPAAGIYLATCNIDVEYGSAGNVWISFRKNHTSDIASLGSLLNSNYYGAHFCLTTLVELAAADYVEIEIYHDFGSVRKVKYWNPWSPVMAMRKLVAV